MATTLETVGRVPYPRFLGDFELLREIGRGGMAVVYLARQCSLDRIIALKILPLERTSSSRDIERFYREATLVAKLHHPHVVPVHSVGEVQGSHFIAMDYVAGPSLAAILDEVRDRPAVDVTQGPFPWPATREQPRPAALGSYIEATSRIAAGIARALAHAHTQGVIHRDVKPGNILIDADGASLLTDFGLAHVDGSSTLTLSGDFAGTPYYVSPEQIDPKRGPIDGRSDVYALGATLYQMLTLRPPFEGVTPIQIFREKLVADPLPLRRLNPDVPRDLETIVQHCLERSPGDRYATASELADDLDRFLSFRPIKARRTASWVRAVNLVRRHRLPLATALAASVVMSVILFAFRVYERSVEARSRDARQTMAVAALEAAVAQGDLQAADSALDDVAQCASNAEVTRCRLRVERLLGTTLVEQARLKLANLLACIENQHRLEQELESAELELRLEFFDDVRRARLHELRREVPELVAAPERLATEIEGLLAQAVDALTLAQVSTDEVKALRADLYVALYRRAVAASRAGEATSWHAKLLQADEQQRYRAELSEQGTLELWPDSEPRYLFRYEADARQPGRLRPRPFRAPDSADVGEALEVVGVKGTPVVHVGDLVTMIDGESATRGLLVEWVDLNARAGLHGVTPFCRVVSINDRSVSCTADWSLPFDRGERVLHAVLATPRYDIELDAELDQPLHPNTALGMFVGLPAAVLEREAPPFAVNLSVLRDGLAIDVTLEPEGSTRIMSRATANPLVRCAASCIVPGEDRIALRPGSYLLVTPSSVRMPFEITSGTTVVLSRPAVLECPVGYEYVSSGPFHYGGDEGAWGSVAHGEKFVSGFCIGVSEVTAGQWFEFLNDLEVRPRAIAEHLRGGAELLPVMSRFGQGLVLYDRERDRLSPNTNARAPIVAVSRIDVRAYVDWLNRKLTRENSPWRADLPTALEFEKAARGADRRPYPWGQRFDPRYANSAYCRPDRSASAFDAVMGCLDDESPYGVHDLAGSVLEWTSDDPPSGAGLAIVKGGSYTRRDPLDFRLSSQNVFPEELKSPEIGFRIVLRPRQP